MDDDARPVARDGECEFGDVFGFGPFCEIGVGNGFAIGFGVNVEIADEGISGIERRGAGAVSEIRDIYSRIPGSGFPPENPEPKKY